MSSTLYTNPDGTKPGDPSERLADGKDGRFSSVELIKWRLDWDNTAWLWRNMVMC